MFLLITRTTAATVGSITTHSVCRCLVIGFMIVDCYFTRLLLVDEWSENTGFP